MISGVSLCVGIKISMSPGQLLEAFVDPKRYRLDQSFERTPDCRRRASRKITGRLADLVTPSTNHNLGRPALREDPNELLAPLTVRPTFIRVY
jgi:hypothetical protein